MRAILIIALCLAGCATQFPVIGRDVSDEQFDQAQVQCGQFLLTHVSIRKPPRDKAFIYARCANGETYIFRDTQ